jgi:hypothetical protein
VAVAVGVMMGALRTSLQIFPSFFCRNDGKKNYEKGQRVLVQHDKHEKMIYKAIVIAHCFSVFKSMQVKRRSVF